MLSAIQCRMISTLTWSRTVGNKVSTKFTCHCRWLLSTSLQEYESGSKAPAGHIICPLRRLDSHVERPCGHPPIFHERERIVPDPKHFLAHMQQWFLCTCMSKIRYRKVGTIVEDLVFLRGALQQKTHCWLQRTTGHSHQSRPCFCPHWPPACNLELSILSCGAQRGEAIIHGLVRVTLDFRLQQRRATCNCPVCAVAPSRTALLMSALASCKRRATFNCPFSAAMTNGVAPS